MTLPRKIALFLLVIVLLAATGRYFALELPTLRWFFSFECPGFLADFRPEWKMTFPDIIGWTMLGMLFAVAVNLWTRGGTFEWNPMTIRRFKRFRSLTRGYRSFLLLLALLLITIPDHALVGRKALVVRYQGQWFFPAFVTHNYNDGDFGGDPQQGANYRELAQRFQQDPSGNWLILPLIPWDTTFDTDELQKVSLVNKEGTFYEKDSDKPYQGLATCFYSDQATAKFKESSFRKGRLQGLTTVYNRKGDPVAREHWQAGTMNKREAEETGEATESAPVEGNYFALKYPPAAPSWTHRHLLGTDSRGWDLAAQLYGGLQVVCKASILYVLITFFVGISVGLISGYFGGLFDLVMQRVIEILSNMPFLFIVMIISSRIGRENVSIFIIVSVLSFFSWLGVSAYKRTAAYKEKARDYVAAARVLGAGTPRIIFRHILPNVLSTTITLVPFYVTGVATSLTALDFIGFGLPDRYPSWGTLLADGLANLEAPWIVGSVFVVLVLLLLLITFVGEAVREAFDPKKFTTYS
jgi:microcin C transport system permease protein